MCVYMYKYIHICLYAHMQNICTNTRTNTYMNACIYIRTCLGDTYVYIEAYILCVYIYKWMYENMLTVYVCMYACMHVCMCVTTYVYYNMCVYINIHITCDRHEQTGACSVLFSVYIYIYTHVVYMYRLYIFPKRYISYCIPCTCINR